jgi:hypothetical protein
MESSFLPSTDGRSPVSRGWRVSVASEGDAVIGSSLFQSSVMHRIGRATTSSRPFLGPSLARNAMQGLRMGLRRPIAADEIPENLDDPEIADRCGGRQGRCLSGTGSSPRVGIGSDAIGPFCRLGSGIDRWCRSGSDLVRTVMETLTILRVGSLTLALGASCGSAAALDPTARASATDPLIQSSVQALAPQPEPEAAPIAVPMGEAVRLPPGVSQRLVGKAAPAPATSSSAVASDAFRAGTRLYYQGDRKQAIEQLRRAAENGHPIAQWKLGRIYQTGDGVPANDAKAFEFYNQVANNHADDSPGSPQAAFVASAFVALGSYYMKGIENTAIRPNIDKAREIYTYAASYFGDADAQYNLGRLYLEPSSSERDPKQAARWLRVAARKGHSGAQALLGQLLFTGDEDVPRRPAQGLMWLTIARTNAHGVSDDWIRDAQEQAFSVASETERRQGVAQAQDWIAKAGNP